MGTREAVNVGGSAALPGAPTNGPRRIRRRRPLPGGRAVVGGFLVATAAVGIFAAYTAATSDLRTPYVVARHNLAIGDRIVSADLELVPMQLSSELGGHRAFTRAGARRLVGAAVIAPIAAGELVQASEVIDASGEARDRQLSFAIEPSRAVGGKLQPGELVDVISTYGTGTDAYTVVVARSVRVIAKSDSTSSLGGRAGEIVTLSLGSSLDELAVAHAVDAGQVSLVRATGAAPADDPGTYRSARPAGH